MAWWTRKPEPTSQTCSCPRCSSNFSRAGEKEADMRRRSVGFTVLLTGLLASVSLNAQTSPVVIRAGHFPNITHSQGVIGQANGWFDKALAPQARVEWKIFNAGPSVIEALYAGAIDLAYIGPNPAINR